MHVAWIQVIKKNDESILDLSRGLKSVWPASKKTFAAASTELQQLEAGVGLVERLAADTPALNADSPVKRPIPAIHLFLCQATEALEGLRQDMARARGKFNNLLRYFGEEPHLSPAAFFSTLGAFLQASRREGGRGCTPRCNPSCAWMVHDGWYRCSTERRRRWSCSRGWRRHSTEP